MSLLYESFLRDTHSNSIQEWFQDLKNLLTELEGIPDPDTSDIQLAFHLSQMIENFELMESNLLERRRIKNKGMDGVNKKRSVGSSILFD
jgi:competence protein ComGF